MREGRESRGKDKAWLAWEDRDDQGEHWGFGGSGVVDEPQGRSLSRREIVADDSQTLFRDGGAWNLPDGIEECLVVIRWDGKRHPDWPPRGTSSGGDHPL